MQFYCWCAELGFEIFISTRLFIHSTNTHRRNINNLNNNKRLSIVLAVPGLWLVKAYHQNYRVTTKMGILKSWKKRFPLLSCWIRDIVYMIRLLTFSYNCQSYLPINPIIEGHPVCVTLSCLFHMLDKIWTYNYIPFFSLEEGGAGW